MTARPSAPVLGLGAVAIAAAVAAVLEIGPPQSSARTVHELVTAQRGVVQSTVTGTGNVEAGADVDASFQTGGTLASVDVRPGERVHRGQLLATLDPTSAQLQVDQAQENLDAAQDALSEAQQRAADTATTVAPDSTEDVSLPLTSPTAASSTTTTATAKTGAQTGPSRGGSVGSAPGTRTVTQTETVTAPSPPSARGSGSSRSGGGSGSDSTTTENPTTAAGAVASAQASVDSAEASLHTAQNTLKETRLVAATGGTIVSMADLQVGDAVTTSGSGSGSGGSSAGAGSAPGQGSGGASTSDSGAAASGSLGGSSSGSSGATETGGGGSGAANSTPFAQIVDTSSMTMTVALDESDISQVKVGQTATVTVQALTGVSLGAHVSAVSTVGSDSDGVVSYDVTLALDQHEGQVRPGMSASAAIVTGQSSGVTLPSSAVSATGSTATVQIDRAGRTRATQVVVGVRGSDRTQIVSGLSPGQRILVTERLPKPSSSSAASSDTLGSAGGRLGGGARRLGGGRRGLR